MTDKERLDQLTEVVNTLTAITSALVARAYIGTYDHVMDRQEARLREVKRLLKEME